MSKAAKEVRQEVSQSYGWFDSRCLHNFHNRYGVLAPVFGVIDFLIVRYAPSNCYIDSR